MPSDDLDSARLYSAALSSLSIPIPSPTDALRLSAALPLSKHIPKTRFLVDSFRPPYRSSFTYFLSHFHSDHYSGLGCSWVQGPVFASPITATLVIRILNVPSQLVFPLPLREAVVIDGVEVTLIDANHCPGAVQFLFKLPGNVPETYVHTGDFRFHDSMVDDPLLGHFVCCNAVFLDTTYCNPKFTFPSQEEAVDYVVSVIEKAERNQNILFLVATYVIGKEKILLEVARRCKRLVYVESKKMEILRVIGNGKADVFTEDEKASDVHVVGWNILGETWPYFRPNFPKIKELMEEKGYSRAVGFVPTGWTYEVKRNKFPVRIKDSIEIHLVPYSEHSNYDELRQYVKFLRPKRVIPTVGADVEKVDSKHAIKIQKHFTGLVDEMANKNEFLMGFLRGLPENAEKVKIDCGDERVCQSNPEGCASHFSSAAVEPSSKGLHSLEENEVEESIREIKDCLPSWVTQEQLSDLIKSSQGDSVDAVSRFYERETEFYQQVFPNGTAILASDSYDTEVESTEKQVSPTRESEAFRMVSWQNLKPPSARRSSTASISSVKRKSAFKSKQVKKLKNCMKPESGSSKQSTITKFFNKATLRVNGIDVVETTSSGFSSLDSDVHPFTEEADQFINIIGNPEWSTEYAVKMLSMTNGDINKALDIHYRQHETGCGEKLTQPLEAENMGGNQQEGATCTSFQDNDLQERNMFLDQSTEGLQVSNSETTPVSFSLEHYKPVDHACWMAGKPAPYIHLARTFELVEAERGKIKAISMLCNMFRSLLALSPEDVLPAVYLCTNRIASSHQNVELNIGGSLVSSALEEACGTTRSRIREMYTSLGDLGDVAQFCRQTQKLLIPPPPLYIKDVFLALRKISEQTGSRSISRKKTLIVNLLRSCREKEVKFIVRTLIRNLRIGAMMKSVIPALAQAVAFHFYDSCPNGRPKDLKDKVQFLSSKAVEAYNVVPDLDIVVSSLVKNGIDFSALTLSMIPGIPIKPMLAKITNGVAEVLGILQNKAFTCEYKYDGQRAQIHRLQDGKVRIFSRNGDETTSRFPDLINIIRDSCKHTVETFIIDAEVCAVDRMSNKLRSFQELASRERGSKDSVISVDKIKVDICVFAFDIMFADGENLLGLPLRQRREYLKSYFPEEQLGYFEYAKEMTIEADDSCKSNEQTTTKINTFLQDSMLSSCEGIMVKSLDVDAEYRPSKRTDTWLKVKRDYVDGLNDSLDLVPIGSWHGNGRKAGW